MTERDDLRHQLPDLAWRGVQVFIASLLVELVADLGRLLHPEGLWRECAVAASIAVLSQVLTWAAWHIGHRP